MRGPKKTGRKCLHHWLVVFAISGACVGLKTDLLAEESAFGPTSPSRQPKPTLDKGNGDGVYGRFSGDTSYRIALGAQFDWGTETVRPLGMLELVAYQTLGAYAAFAQRVGSGDELERSVSVGLTLTPLFLLRWSKARVSGYAFWDLTLDSLGIFGGLQLAQPRGAAFASEPGFEGGALLGVPLFGRAQGLWVRCRGQVVTGRPPMADQGPVEASILLALSWEGFFQAGLLKAD